MIITIYCQSFAIVIRHLQRSPTVRPALAWTYARETTLIQTEAMEAMERVRCMYSVLRTGLPTITMEVWFFISAEVDSSFEALGGDLRWVWVYP